VAVAFRATVTTPGASWQRWRSILSTARSPGERELTQPPACSGPATGSSPRSSAPSFDHTGRVRRTRMRAVEIPLGRPRRRPREQRNDDVGEAVEGLLGFPDIDDTEGALTPSRDVGEQTRNRPVGRRFQPALATGQLLFPPRGTTASSEDCLRVCRAQISNGPAVPWRTAFTRAARLSRASLPTTG